MFQLITERLSLLLSNGARHRDVIGAPTDADARVGHTSAHQTFCGYRVSTLGSASISVDKVEDP